MKTIQYLILCCMASVIKGQPPCSLAQNFWIVSTSEKFIECDPCPDCPEGLGLNIQCGSTITNGTKIECVQCKETETYSDRYGVGSCKPCQDCGLRNVLQECASDQNRKCGRKCPKGYFFDGRITDCRETTPATVSIESTQGIMPQPSSLYRGIVSTSSLENEGVPLPGNHVSESVLGKKNTTQGRKGKIFIILGITATIVLIAILTPLATVCWIKCRMSARTEQEDLARKLLKSSRVTENSPSCSLLETNVNLAVSQNNTDSAESLMASQGSESSDGDSKDCGLTNDIPEDFKLADFPRDVEDSILQLDSDSSPVLKNWIHVAHRFNLSQKDINLIKISGKKPGVSATELLIEKLCSSKCTTLKEFVDVLQELKRNDVANDIISWFRKKQDRCSEEGKN